MAPVYARGRVVPGTSQHEHLSSDHAAISGGSLVVATGSGPPLGCAQYTSACMEIERRQLNAFDLPPEVVDVLLGCRCPLSCDEDRGGGRRQAPGCTSPEEEGPAALSTRWHDKT